MNDSAQQLNQLRGEPDWPPRPHHATPGCWAPHPLSAYCSLDDTAHVPPYSASWRGVGGSLSGCHCPRRTLLFDGHTCCQRRKGAEGEGPPLAIILAGAAVKRRDALAICGACL